MTPEEIATISKLADMLKAKGVRVFRGAGIELEFEAPAAPNVEPDAPTADPDMCRCGHANHAHMNGLCVHGCEAEKCIPEDTAP